MDPTKRRIRKIDRDVQRFVAHALHNTSLSLSDYEMIQTVHHRPGITQGELCRRYSQDKSTVAGGPPSWSGKATSSGCPAIRTAAASICM